MSKSPEFLRFDKCISAVNIIVAHPKNDSKILGLLHHERGLLELPGGKLDPGETVVQAAIREMREETGLDVYILDFPAYVCSSEWQGRKHIVATVLGRICNADLYEDSWLKTTKEGTPEWKFPVQFAAGNFWEYNEPCFEFYNLL